MTVDTTLTGRTPEQEECLRQLCGDIRNAVATWGRAHDRLARLVSDFCNRTDHGIATPRNYIAAVIGCDKAAVCRLVQFAECLPVVVDLLPIGNKLPSQGTLRPSFPLLEDHATVRAVIGDAVEMAEGKRLTAKHVRAAAAPYLAELREKQKPRGGAAHKRFANPESDPENEYQEPPQLPLQRDTGDLLAHLADLFGEAMTLTRDRDEIPDDIKAAVAAGCAAVHIAIECLRDSTPAGEPVGAVA